MNKAELRKLRHLYRHLRWQDAKWQPDPYRTTRQPQERPNRAATMVKVLSDRARDAVTARPLPGPAPVQRGPRARWYVGWRPDRGPGYNMPLHTRVAFRRGSRAARMKQIDRMINPVAVEMMMLNEGLRLVIEQMEAVGYRLAAMEAMRKYHYAMEHGLPY